jgi:nitrate reductase NapE component
MSDDAQPKLERRVKRALARVGQAETERRRLKWFFVLAATTWPLGLVGGPWYAAWIFAGWLVFWGVGAYSNYFHKKQAAINLKNAEDELSAYNGRP